MGVSSLVKNRKVSIVGGRTETIVGLGRGDGKLPGIDALYLLSRTGLDEFVIDEEADRLFILAAIGRRE